jgi:glycosyltransferase involved in cell wall biosynthesis
VRVLLIHDYASPVGGAEIMNEVLVHGLRERGHDVRQLTSTAGLDSAAATRPDYVCRGTTSRWRTLLQTANPWAPQVLRQALREFAPDVVHVRIFQTQLSPLILPVLRGIPAVYHEVWYRAVCPTGNKLLPDGRACMEPAGRACLASGCLPLRDWMPLMAQRHFASRWRDVFDATVANSHATAAALVGEGVSDVLVVPDGVPVSSVRRVLSPTPTVAFVGRLVREKGVDVLLRAFARVVTPDTSAMLDIVGDGPARDSLERLVSQLGLDARVRMYGHLSRSRCDDVAGRAWVQVVPSVWAEPFGIVAAEAMMRGTAVVASASGGLCDIVRHEETGLLVAPGDVDGLSCALNRVLGSAALATQWGDEGRRVATREYTSERFVDRIVDVYGRIIRERPSA